MSEFNEFENGELDSVIYSDDKEIVLLMDQMTIEFKANTETSPDEDEELECNVFNISPPQNPISVDELQLETQDWEDILGPGYWDSNGGSPQWVPLTQEEFLDRELCEDYEYPLPDHILEKETETSIPSNKKTRLDNSDNNCQKHYDKDFHYDEEKYHKQTTSKNRES